MNGRGLLFQSAIHARMSASKAWDTLVGAAADLLRWFVAVLEAAALR
jgi:hypothetical protein